MILAALKIVPVSLGEEAIFVHSKPEYKKTMGDAHQWRVLLEPRQVDFYTRPTPVCCHHCCHPFDGLPVGMPVTYNERKNKMVLRGVYCSVRCCLGANRELRDVRALVRPMWIRYMAKRLYGLPMKDRVRAAPPRRCLRMFGGCLTVEEFRGVAPGSEDMDIVVQTPPLLHVMPEEESILEKLKHHQVTPAIRKKAPPTRKKPGLASSSYTIRRNDTATESRRRRDRLSKLGIRVAK